MQVLDEYLPPLYGVMAFPVLALLPPLKLTNQPPTPRSYHSSPSQNSVICRPTPPQAASPPR
ncbi:hypothetical protein BV22DRAFT_1040593 [Leucogyrophana mollusca]|uniref:Uncharacterized protein n=1 Tax=Leucogyrophana mollusca TaxID=85980 RepID=A0ACB8B4Y3_9AGAM|nr:hypothetical protein BV22DRAFT_1040593 [Leucogyrophana mollusca]